MPRAEPVVPPMRRAVTGRGGLVGMDAGAGSEEPESRNQVVAVGDRGRSVSLAAKRPAVRDRIGAEVKVGRMGEEGEIERY